MEENSHVRHQVGLELVKIHVQAAVESERRSNAGHNLSNQAVQVRESRGRNAKVLLADVVDSLVINLKGL